MALYRLAGQPPVGDEVVEVLDEIVLSHHRQVDEVIETHRPPVLEPLGMKGRDLAGVAEEPREGALLGGVDLRPRSTVGGYFGAAPPHHLDPLLQPHPLRSRPSL